MNYLLIFLHFLMDGEVISIFAGLKAVKSSEIQI